MNNNPFLSISTRCSLSYTLFLLTILFDFQFQAFDFRTTTRNEPFLQLFHCLYVYPLTVSLSRKRNLFIRVELRKDDVDVRRQPLEVNGCHLLSTKSVCFLKSIHLDWCVCFILPGNASQGARNIASKVGSHTSSCWD